MLKTMLRLVAVLLLCLAVPIQGLAGVAAGQCMAFGHHDAGSNHQDAHDGETHDHAGHVHGDEHGAGHGSEDASHSHCGPCTACCASASIAGPVALALPSIPSYAQYAYSQFLPLGVQPEGVYRPPLSL